MTIEERIMENENKMTANNIKIKELGMLADKAKTFAESKKYINEMMVIVNVMSELDSEHKQLLLDRLDLEMKK